MKKMIYRQDIQILRGISVILVVMYHLKIPGFKNGFIGVDIFFVISGYLMAQLYDTGRSLDFISRRAKRIIPAYLSTILLTSFIGFFTLIPSDFKQLIDQARASLFLIPNLYFWNQDSYFNNTQFNPFLNLWSLGVELQFYLIIPLIASIFAKSNKSIVIICIISIISCFVILTISPKTAFYLLPLRLWEFLVGYIVSKRRQRKIQTVNLHLIYRIGILFFIFIILNSPINVYGTSVYLGHPGAISLCIVFITAIILNSNSSSKKGFWNNSFERIGDYSYSIYLIHFPIIVLWNYQPFLGTKLGMEKIYETPIVIVLIILSSAFIFKCIEVPFRKSKYDFKLLAIPFLLLITLSISIDSFHERNFSETEVNINNAFQDRSEYRCGKIFRVFNPMALVCPLNKSDSEPNFLLLGNSHADSIKEVFREVSKEHRVNSYFWVQNNPLMIGGADIEKVYTAINQYKISHVFLHYSKTAVDVSTLNIFLQKLSNEGIFVTILGPVPIWSNGIPYMMWNQEEFTSELNISYENYIQDNFDELRSTKLLLNQYVQFFDVASVFCNKQCIYSSKDQKPFYWDSGHLTLTGSKLLKTPLDGIFKNYLNNSR